MTCSDLPIKRTTPATVMTEGGSFRRLEQEHRQVMMVAGTRVTAKDMVKSGRFWL